MTVEKPKLDDHDTRGTDDTQPDETPEADTETSDDDIEIVSVEEINPFRWLLGRPR